MATTKKTDSGKPAAKQSAARKPAAKKAAAKKAATKKPVAKKAAETRMGGGQGSPEGRAAGVNPGTVRDELDGVREPVAREAMRLAAHKLPIKYKVVTREGSTFES
jgi:ribosomal protein L16